MTLSFARAMRADWLCRCCLLLGVFFSLTSCDLRSAGSLAPGSKPPALQLPRLSGGQIDLAELKGQVVLVNFWTTWCQPCVDEMPDLNALYLKYRDRGLTVLGVAVQDSDANLKNLITSLNIAFPTVFDKQALAQRRFKVNAFPETFLVKRDGTLAMIFDPETGEPVTKIIGSRKWLSPEMSKVIEGLLSESPA